MNNPSFDLIIFGATSFVGKLICQNLVDQAAAGTDVSSIRWAIAGRSKAKLDALKTRLGKQAKDIKIIVADAGSESDMVELCEQTRMVMSTVGPYALYGEPLVKACAESGTHYCDLTGEPQWIAPMLERYEASAKKTGARIVHCCGFDSIPSDLGVYFLQQQAVKLHGATCQRVKMRVKGLSGGFSGGTVASLMNVSKEVSDPNVRKIMASPYALCPDNMRPDKRQPSVKSAYYDEDYKAWCAPFVMAGINTRIVHRSNALFREEGDGYGENFVYDEGVITGKGLKGRVAAFALTAGLGAFMLGTVLPPSRWFLEKFILPAPGEGPTAQQQQDGYFSLLLKGEAFSKGKGAQSLTVKVTGDRDPGYGSTAKMITQAAVCLLKDVDETIPGGFWTPATLMGDDLLQRLQNYAGLSFTLMD